jgi:hypothetical protein
MKKDFSEELEKAYLPIRFNRESDWNETDESDRQEEKQEEPRILTLQGMTIDIREHTEKALASMKANSQSESNEIEERSSQSEKHEAPILSICPGMVTEHEEPKYRIRIFGYNLTMQSLSTANDRFARSIETSSPFKCENAEPSMDVTVRGMMSDFRFELENAFDSILVT